MILLNLILTFLLNNGVPFAQVQAVNTISLYAEPDFSSEMLAKARPGDVLLIYAIEENWAQTEQGWCVVENMPLEPAVVHYSAVLNSPVEIAPVMPEMDSVIRPDDVTGVVAIFENRALVYSEFAAGWIDLSQIEIVDPSPGLIDFVEQGAYVQIETANLYTAPDEKSELLATLPLGQEATILYQNGEWALVRSRHEYGWGKITDFDVALKPVARGKTTASPINLYYPTPQDSVIGLLDYQEEVLVLGQDETGKWLYLRRQNGTEGWSPARYIEMDVTELPTVERD